MTEEKKTPKAFYNIYKLDINKILKIYKEDLKKEIWKKHTHENKDNLTEKTSSKELAKEKKEVEKNWKRVEWKITWSWIN